MPRKKMSEEERRLRDNELRRNWYHKNPEKQKAYNAKYWRKKIMQELENNENNDEVNENEQMVSERN